MIPYFNFLLHTYFLQKVKVWDQAKISEGQDQTTTCNFFDIFEKNYNNFFQKCKKNYNVRIKLSHFLSPNGHGYYYLFVQTFEKCPSEQNLKKSVLLNMMLFVLLNMVHIMSFHVSFLNLFEHKSMQSAFPLCS